MFSVIITVILTVFIFGLLIAVHELGHYLVARACGVGIKEYSIGMGPAIHTWKCKYNDVSLRWFPIGGYVSMVGEIPGEEPAPEDAGKTPLNSVAIWKRMLIVLAGPFTNILIAFLIMFVVVTSSGVVGTRTVAVITDKDELYENYPADAKPNAAEKLAVGDEIIEIDGTSVHCSNDISYLIALRGKDPIDILVIRDGVETLLEDVRFPETVTEGIAMGTIDFKIYAGDFNFGNIVKESFFQSYSIIRMSVESLVRALRGEYGWEAVSGPVGIGEQVNKVVSETDSFGESVEQLTLLTIIISISLGITNLLPLPVLDGGRFVLYVIEAIRRKPLNQKVEAIINTAFTVVLLALMAVIALKDIIGLF